MPKLRALVVPHKTNNYKPHLIRHHGLVVCLLLVVAAQLAYNFQITGSWKVLAYATEMSAGALLTYTNQNRTAAGQTALSLNSKLNSAAQSKAQHMISNNYWAHVAPDGTTPWYFIDQVGYNYDKAGENLAYGFSTSSATVTGWMNSPSHKANILTASYQDVGFGIANGASYQGGQYTVVVAMYGDPVGNSTAASPASTPAAAPVISSAPTSSPSTPTPTEPELEKVTKRTPAKPVVAREKEVKPALTELSTSRLNDSTISNFEALRSGQASWALYVTVSVLAMLGLVYLYRHVLFMHALVMRGERLMHSHPLLEASLVYLLIWVLLTAQHGAIQ